MTGKGMKKNKQWDNDKSNYNMWGPTKCYLSI